MASSAVVVYDASFDVGDADDIDRGSCNRLQSDELLQDTHSITTEAEIQQLASAARHRKRHKYMTMPETADDLCQFIHFCRWMSQAIPAFAARVAPLNRVLEEAYVRSGRRTKRPMKDILLRTLSWGAIQEDAFKDLQDTLRNAVSLAYPKPDMITCVYADASDQYWSAVVTQTS